MKACIWYHTADKQPSTSGYYLSYRGWGIGGKADGDSDWGYVYYDKKRNEWRTYESRGMFPDIAIVYYWTDATPDVWVENDAPVIRRQKIAENPILSSAWNDVEKAIEKYEMLKELLK